MVFYTLFSRTEERLRPNGYGPVRLGARFSMGILGTDGGGLSVYSAWDGPRMGRRRGYNAREVESGRYGLGVRTNVGC